MSTRIRALRQLCSRFVTQSNGSMAIQFALALLPLVGLMGAATDYTRTSRIKDELQASLDTAVLAGARDGSDEWVDTANRVFDSNVASALTFNASPSFTKDENDDFIGTISVTVPTELIKVLGIHSMNLTVDAVASLEKVEDNSCILTLGQGASTSSESLTFNGAPNIQLNECTIRSNTSMRCNGHGGGSIGSIAVGSVEGCSNPHPNATPVPDVYAELAENIVPSCGGARPGATWAPSVPPVGIAGVSKGAYTEYHICGDLTLSGLGYLTGDAPSTDTVIIIENGSLNLANNASINTKRVGFVLTGNNNYPSSINFPNGNGHASTLTLSPPTAQGNPWRGISLYQDPVLTDVDHDWGPAVTLNPDGVVYLPNSNVVMSGNGAGSVSGCTKFISNTFRTNGSVNLNYSQTASSCSSLGIDQWIVTDFPYLSE